jgi:hypothetical protein
MGEIPFFAEPEISKSDVVESSAGLTTTLMPGAGVGTVSSALFVSAMDGLSGSADVGTVAFSANTVNRHTMSSADSGGSQ